MHGLASTILITDLQCSSVSTRLLSQQTQTNSTISHLNAWDFSAVNAFHLTESSMKISDSKLYDSSFSESLLYASQESIIHMKNLTVEGTSGVQSLFYIFSSETTIENSLFSLTSTA